MIKRRQMKQNLHILISQQKKEKIYIAHCLDMDIAAQGTTEQEAVNELRGLIQTQLEYCLEDNMLNTIFRPAPKAYWDKFYASQQEHLIRNLSRHKTPIQEITSHLEFSYA